MINKIRLYSFLSDETKIRPHTKKTQKCIHFFIAPIKNFHKLAKRLKEKKEVNTQKLKIIQNIGKYKIVQHTVIVPMDR